MTDQSAVVIGASGGIGSAVADALEASGTLSRSSIACRDPAPGLDLEDEATIAAAAASVAEGPSPCA